MSQLLKQSTATTVLVGPVLDSTGAVYTGMVIGDFNITKNGTTAAMAASATATHDHNGMYLIALTTGNSDTLGRLVISCNKSTYAMSAFIYTVQPATVFDCFVTNAATAAGGLGDVQRIAGTAQTARDLGASVLVGDKTGFSLATTQAFNNTGTWTGNVVGTLSTLTTYTGNTVQTGDNYARLGAPAGASHAADTAAVKADAAAVRAQTDQMSFSATGYTIVDCWRWLASNIQPVDTNGYPKVTIKGGTGAGELSLASGVVKASDGSGNAIAPASATTAIQAKTDLIPAAPASTTNITAGTITTATNLTNAPTSGDLTATMKASVITAATAATPIAASVAGAVGSIGAGGITASSFAAAAITSATAVSVGAVNLVNTLTTYSGNTPQTGDGYLLATNANYGLAQLARTTGSVATAGTVTNPVTATSATMTSMTAGSIGLLFTLASGKTYADSGAGKLVYEIANNASGDGGSGLEGPNPLTVTTVDANAAAVPFVDFTVAGQGSSRTGAAGTVVVGVNTGAISIVARPTNGLLFNSGSGTSPGTTAITLTGTAASIDAADPGQCTAYITIYDPNGNVVEGATMNYRLKSTDNDGGWKRDSQATDASDVTGLIQVTLARNSIYQFSLDGGIWYDEVIGNEATKQLTPVLGKVS